MLEVPSMQQSEKRSATVSVMVTPSVKAEIEKIKEEESRSISQIAGLLLERGLEAFRQDGELKSRLKDNKLPVIRAKTESDSPRKKNKG
jgi:rRNA-processing protein FCF1